MAERLSMLDTMFLDLEQMDEAAHMHIGAALVFDPLPGGGTPQIGVLRDHMRERMGILPRFAQQLSAPHAGSLAWLTWEPARDFDLDAHVHHASLPAPGDEADLNEWLADFWSHRLDRRRPLWEMTLLDGLEDGRWALATKTHHCLVDGVGSMDIGYALLDATPDAPPLRAAAAAGGATSRARGRGSGASGSRRGWSLRGARAGVGAALHPRQSLERVGAAAELIVRDEVIAAPQIEPERADERHPPLRHGAPGARRGQGDQERASAAPSTTSCSPSARAGCAICCSSAASSRRRAGLRAQVPVNIRAEDREHALGNELTSLFVELPVEEADPLTRYRRVVERAEQLKAGSQRTGGKTIVDLADMGPPLAGGAAGQVDVRRQPDVQPDDHQRARAARAPVRVRRAAAWRCCRSCRCSPDTRSASRSSATPARWSSASTPTASRRPGRRRARRGDRALVRRAELVLGAGGLGASRLVAQRPPGDRPEVGLGRAVVDAEGAQLVHQAGQGRWPVLRSPRRRRRGARPASAPARVSLLTVDVGPPAKGGGERRKAFEGRTTMKNVIAAALACAATALALALAPGSALAGKGGKNVHKGRTAQGRTIRVAVYKRSIELKHFTIKLRCRKGGTLIDVESGFLPSKLRKRNRIHDHQVGSTDDVYIRGRLYRHQLKGAIRVRDRWGKKNKCDSKWVRFHTKR